MGHLRCTFRRRIYKKHKEYISFLKHVKYERHLFETTSVILEVVLHEENQKNFED